MIEFCYRVRQILIELHPVQKWGASKETLKIANDFFKMFRDNGYVIFHKVPNSLNNKCGNVVEYSFLLAEGLNCPKQTQT
jgi:hypothetical protein